MIHKFKNRQVAQRACVGKACESEPMVPAQLGGECVPNGKKELQRCAEAGIPGTVFIFGAHLGAAKMVMTGWSF